MLPHVEIRLDEDIFKTLMIGVDIAMITISLEHGQRPQAPNHGLDNFFMLLELMGGIGHHLAFLHKNTTETDVRGITIDIKVLVNIWLSENGSGSKTIFESLKGFFTSLGPFELDPIFQ
jgi:hypothetical protein